MTKKPYFNWDEETKTTTCVLSDRERIFIGTARCHPEDEDMYTEKVGCEIALNRATIKALQSYKEDEIKPALKALKQLYYSMNRSKNFDPKSYEARMLFRQINQKEDDLEYVKFLIEDYKTYLKKYIDEKDDFYKRIRKNRAKKVKQYK